MSVQRWSVIGCIHDFIQTHQHYYSVPTIHVRYSFHAFIRHQSIWYFIRTYNEIPRKGLCEMKLPPEILEFGLSVQYWKVAQMARGDLAR